MDQTPCVVLDIGGILEVTPETGWLARWEVKEGLAPGTVEGRLGEVFAAGSIGTMTEQQVIAAVAERLPVGRSALERFWNDLWREYLGTLNQELFGWFRDLRPEFRTAILSNSFVGATEREAQLYGFPAVTDMIIYSHEVGLEKPDPRIYALTCERMGTDPAQMIFLDDLEVNCEAARQAGWKAVQFLDTHQAITDVEALLHRIR